MLKLPFSLLLVCVAFLPPGVNAHGRMYCDISAEPVVQLGKDRTTGRYSVISSGNTEQKPGERRGLSFDNLRGDHALKDAVEAIEVSSRQLQDASSDVVSVRECRCSYTLSYCPASKQLCGVPRHEDGESRNQCINEDNQQQFVRNMWLYLVMVSGILVAILLFTGGGRFMLGSLPALCIGGYTKFRANLIMRRDPELADSLIRQYLRRRISERRRITGERLPVAVPVSGESDEDDDARLPPYHSKRLTSLALRTRRYRKEETAITGDERADTDDFDDKDACTICFAPLEDGDRVGALACDHDFHVECLKLWLARRNCCPLCQSMGATPQYEEIVPCDSDTNPSERMPSQAEEAQPESRRSETTSSEGAPGVSEPTPRAPTQL